MVKATVTVGEAAKILAGRRLLLLAEFSCTLDEVFNDASKMTAYNLAKKGELPVARRLGGRYVIGKVAICDDLENA